jgi:uncharacterized membrane protein (UPF0127 family)
MNRTIKFGVIALLAVIALLFYYRIHPLEPSVIINGHKIVVELALSSSEKERGLGYRSNLAKDHGMIFIYDHKDIYPFWMKGMNFPLDYIWIDGNKVADLSIDVPVMTSNAITVIKPMVPVDKILEVNAGTISKFGIKIGDQVIFRN